MAVGAIHRLGGLPSYHYYYYCYYRYYYYYYHPLLSIDSMAIINLLPTYEHLLYSLLTPA